MRSKNKQFLLISGHFNFTLMLGEKGFNEIDMSLLKHLLFNKKPMAFVRTQCDSAINGILDAEDDKVFIMPKICIKDVVKGNEEMTFEDGLKSLQMTFRKYIKTQVLSKVKVDDLGKGTISNYLYHKFHIEIFFIGLPPKKFPDFEKIVRRLLSGEILEAVGMVEALESELSDLE